METASDLVIEALNSDLNHLFLVIIGLAIIAIAFGGYTFWRIMTRAQNNQSELIEHNAKMLENLIDQQSTLKDQSGVLQRLIESTSKAQSETRELITNDHAERIAVMKATVATAQAETLASINALTKSHEDNLVRLGDRIIADILPISSAIHKLERTISDNLTTIKTEIGLIEDAVISAIAEHYKTKEHPVIELKEDNRE